MVRKDMSMKKGIRGFIAGAITTALLSATVFTAFAEPVNKTITAVYNNIRIYIDGELLDPKDGDGNKVEPFIYNGTTYLPIRAVSEALGKEVTWDGNTNSVYLATKSADESDLLNVSDQKRFETSLKGYKYGNTSGNITNLAAVAVQGDWIYYSNKSDDDKLYKIKKDGTNKTKLDNEGMCQNICVIDGWIYYTRQTDELLPKSEYSYQYLNKIRTDGTQKTRLHKGSFGNLSIVNDKMYFTDNLSDLEGYQLFSANLDGTNLKTICKGVQCYYVNVVGDEIYFADALNDKQLSKVKTDGSSLTKLGEVKAHSLNVVGDWVYYVCESSDGNSIYKVKTDGTTNTLLCNEDANFINVNNGWIYYTIDQKNGIYKVKTDGTSRTVIKEDWSAGTVIIKEDGHPYCLNVIDDWVYYNYDYYFGYREFLRRVKIDGTKDEEF